MRFILIVSRYFVLNRNMFDKPNKDAFYIVTHFLLEKLNPARFSEAYRSDITVFHLNFRNLQSIMFVLALLGFAGLFWTTKETQSFGKSPVPGCER